MSLNLNNMGKNFKFFWFNSIAYIVRLPTEMCINNQNFHALSIFRQNELIWHSFCHQIVPLPQEHSGANACSMELPRLKKYKRSVFLVVKYNIIRYGTSYEVWDSEGSSSNSQEYIQCLKYVWKCLKTTWFDPDQRRHQKICQTALNSFFLKKGSHHKDVLLCIFHISSK